MQTGQRNKKIQAACGAVTKRMFGRQELDLII